MRSAAFWLSATFVLIVLFAAAPVISVLIASGIATALGCTLNEGGSNPCPFLGVDLGDMLVTLFVLGWLGLVTLPIGAMALVVWLVALVITLLLRRRRQRMT